jgi:hypothetical protein
MLTYQKLTQLLPRHRTDSDMQMTPIKSQMIAAILAFVALATGADAARADGQEIPGISNFGRVTEPFYRGGQPALAGFIALQGWGGYCRRSALSAEKWRPRSAKLNLWE